MIAFMLGWIWGDGVGVSVQILTALQAPQKKALEKIGCGPAKPSKTVDQILGDFWFLEVRQCGAAGSDDFLAFRDLPEPEKRLNQLAFAAHGHLREALEPFAVRDFRPCFQPSGEELELKDGNLAPPRE